ncbi:hypothetical protein ABZZ17_11790 [Streptomyces sp. NPDC006512]|uniref:hypothetical protein n=1 Tax=Streptomyces sp. NPDC006512 TaxID=3154307 RepID=UPI0033AEB8D5
MSETDRSRPRRRRRPIRLAAALLALLGLIGYGVVQNESIGGAGAPHCTVRAAEAGGGGGRSFSLSPEQARYAATIAAVGTTKGMPERAVTIAVATAMQESALRNLDHGDRDSLGLFQQRPSQGWGTPDQIMDPVYSAGIFYDRLEDVPGYAGMPLTVAAQKVQRSGFPDAYAKHEPDAVLLTAAFTGRARSVLECAGPKDGPEGDPARVREGLSRDFGPAVLPKAGAPRGNAAPRDAAEVALRVKEQRRGWELAHWAVAHASELGIQRVSYDGMAWIAGEHRGAWVPGVPSAAGDPRAAGPEDVRIFLTRPR